MPIDTETPQSPGWWLKRLEAQLVERGKRLERLDRYYRGDPPMACSDPNMVDAYREFQRRARSNFAELVVEAVRERMIPVAFRTSADFAEGGDSEAWRIWQRAGLEVESRQVHEWMLALGIGYVIVGAPDENKIPLITAEDPRQVITAADPQRPRTQVAALKLFHDDVQGVDLAYVYLPGQVHVAFRAVRRSPTATSPQIRFNAQTWEWDDSRATALPIGDVLPVVPFENRRALSEFEGHLDLLDRINHTILQRMWITTLQAFRQRAAIGLPNTDEHGNLVNYDDIFTADPGAMWQLPEGASIWESGQADLTPILSSVKDDVVHLSAVTRTPMHMLMPEGANQTAEGAALAREGLVFKAEDRIKRATAAWNQVMSIAFLAAGQPDRADLDALHVVWLPPERPSLAERYDAASKAVPAGVPWRTIMREILQFPPDQLAQMETERAHDSLLFPNATQAARPAAVGAPAGPARPPVGG